MRVSIEGNQGESEERNCRKKPPPRETTFTPKPLSGVAFFVCIALSSFGFKTALWGLAVSGSHPGLYQWLCAKLEYLAVPWPVLPRVLRVQSVCNSCNTWPQNILFDTNSIEDASRSCNS